VLEFNWQYGTPRTGLNEIGTAAEHYSQAVTKMHVIIVGAGAIGSQLINIATRSGNDVVVVENDERRANAVAQEFDCLVINRDATTLETLIDAGGERADAIISTTDEDAVNIMVMLLSDEIGIPSLVSVVHNPEHMDLFRQIGANVIENPQRLIAEYLFRAVQRPSVKDFMTLAGGAEVFEVTVTEGAPISNNTIEEAADQGILTDDFLVVAIERAGETIMPKGNTEIHLGDLLTVFSLEGATPEVISRLAPA
jgi:trk system potassium uptake protein TrkA